MYIYIYIYIYYIYIYILLLKRDYTLFVLHIQQFQKVWYFKKIRKTFTRL